ncbi:S4 domain-containing protein, partial [Catellicoccus marimammalium]|uniref:S4 domain-containing protein n=2 Tax=Catellicoccus marimammalium TaxID=300419 RepID=UPI0039F10753
TFLSKEEIDELAQKVETEPEKREAQRRLAEEVTTFVHGKEAMENAEKLSHLLFKGEVEKLSKEEIDDVFAHEDHVSISNSLVNIVDLLVNTGIEPSKRQAREDIENGAIYINGRRNTDVNSVINPNDNYDGEYLIIRKGKKKYYIAKIIK